MMNARREIWTPVCAVLGALCLVGTAAVSLTLERGGPLDRAGVAAVLILLALACLGLLRLEGYRGKTLLMMLLPIGAAFLIRALCMDYAGTDYKNFLTGWYAFFRENGGFQALAWEVGDYNMPYLYFIAAMSYFDVPDLYMFKLFSIVFDVVLAWGGLRLVRILVKGRGEGKENKLSLAAFALMLFVPTVVLNGAFWGQCDVIYGALTVHALALVLEGRNKSSVALLAVAFSFKLQTVFLMPLWGVLWLGRRVKFRQLLIFPVTYVVTILPAWLLGKPLSEILGVYLDQAGEYPRLTLNAPSVYQFLPRNGEFNEELLSRLGIAAAFILVLVLLGVGLYFGRRLGHDQIMAVAVVLAVGVPFFLPHMHERYFFLADVLSVCWAFTRRDRIPVAVLVCASSLASYCVYLRLKFNFVFYVGQMQFVMVLEALAMLVALVLSIVLMISSLKNCKGIKLNGGDWA